MTSTVSAGERLSGAAPPQTPNQKAVAWIDRLAKVQVLFSDKDITRIRKKLADAGAGEPIETVHGVGYKLGA